MKTLQGIEILKKDKFNILKNKKIALLSHPASVDSNYEHILSLLVKNNIDVRLIYAPEHGFLGAMQDMEEVKIEKHNSKIKIKTLYGDNFESLFPKIKDLKEIDTILIDLQDIGSRYYTFVYTASFFLEKAKILDKEIIVLDRINPIGNKIEGNLIEKGFESFVGYYPYFLNRHSLTIGEMLKIINNNINSNLKIIKIENYKKEDARNLNLNWTLPSPNMPTIESAFLYPGGCLIEGTNLSEGRGTTKPFHFVGAPYINSHKLKNILDSHKLSGVKFREISFKPMFQKYKNSLCHGIEVHIDDFESFEPLKTYTTIIYDIYNNFKDFKFRTEIYEFVDNPIAIDLLFGTDKIRKLIENKASLKEVYKLLLPPQKAIDIINKFKIY